MIDYSKPVKIPAWEDINSNLTNLTHSVMIEKFGKPGKLSTDCSEVTNKKVLADLVTLQITPNFKLRGNKYFISAVKRAFDKVKIENLELYNQAKTAGGLCCRAVRGSTTRFSNHSWGFAADFKFAEDLTPMGAKTCQLGLLVLYHYMHEEGIFWLAEAKRSDAMHFEYSLEKTLAIYG